MVYSVFNNQDIIIPLRDDSSVTVDPRYITKDLCTLFVYYRTKDETDSSFISSLRYEKGSGIYYVPFFYNSFDLIVSTDDDGEIIVEEVDRTDG